MNPSTLSEKLRATDQVQEHRGNPGMDSLPQESHSTDQTPPFNPTAPHVSDEGAFATFAGGDGI
jgi:hypothetical protein